jgi:antitoxin component of MazEF toxin-antitoxin module
MATTLPLKLTRIGNSLGVRLPAGEIRRLNLARVGSELARDIHL